MTPFPLTIQYFFHNRDQTTGQLLTTLDMELVAEARDVVRAHVDTLVGQLTQIIADGVTQGEFTVADPAAAGRAVFDATARFHNPAHAPKWSDPGIDAAFEGVWSLILDGLSARRVSA